MPIFMLRISDGSFFLQEADNAEQAKELIAEGETCPFDPREDRIVDVLQMKRNTFSSRWWYETNFMSEEDETVGLGTASGMLDAGFETPILKHSYPAIAQAFDYAVAQPIGDPSLPGDTPMIDPRNMAAWDATEQRIHKKIRDAIAFESRRHQPKKNVN